MLEYAHNNTSLYLFPKMEEKFLSIEGLRPSIHHPADEYLRTQALLHMRSTPVFPNQANMWQWNPVLSTKNISYN